jgi:hypothetical protein
LSDIDEAALEVARKAVEDILVDFRDGRMSELTGGNGFVIREKDGRASPLIRLRTADGLRIGIRAYIEAVSK